MFIGLDKRFILYFFLYMLEKVEKLFRTNTSFVVVMLSRDFVRFLASTEALVHKRDNSLRASELNHPPVPYSIC
jgi:hypothetical protein